ncbi:MAG: hypothetical protein OXI03_08105 [Chloroflexota bacterium]|nr:hypothetical protein [Chloroflexota bacterium]
MVPTQEEMRRRYLDKLPERAERFREVAGVARRDITSCLGVAGRHVAAWRKGRVPSGEAMCTLLQLSASVPGGPAAPYPEFAASCANDGGEGEEPWA